MTFSPLKFITYLFFRAIVAEIFILESISKNLNIAAHIAGSILFLFYSLIGTPDWPNVEKIWNHPIGRTDIFFQMELLIFFYLNYYILLERFFIPKRYLIYGLITLLCLILMVPVTEIIVYKIVTHSNHPHIPKDGQFRLMKSLIYFIFLNRKTHLFLIVIFGSFLFKTRSRLKIAEQEKESSELNFLKTQVNPHFLLNTLNNIHSMSIQESEATPNAIVKLSSMMRYVLSEAQTDQVPLEKEINYIQDYIQLQKLRVTESQKIYIDIEGDFSQKTIAPLILIGFLEYAFKDSVNSGEESDTFISAKIDGPAFRFKVRNQKANTANTCESETDPGIINAKRRLELIYPSQYSLEIQDSESEYNIDLSIDLHA